MINSLNNCISGSIYVATHQLHAGAPCTFNGWVGQLSVQATDFSILAISITTLLVVTKLTRLDCIPGVKRALLCLAIWIVPFISSTTALVLGELKPVAGNWCWIAKERADLRYALAHGWRFAIIFTTVCIYIYIYQYLSRHFKSLVATPVPFAKRAPSAVLGLRGGGGRATWPATHQRLDGNDDFSQESDIGRAEITATTELTVDLEDGYWQPAPPTRIFSGAPSTNLIELKQSRTPSHLPEAYEGVGGHDPRPNDHHRINVLSLGSSTQCSSMSRRFTIGPERSPQTEVKRMLLLNGYPIMYIILWTPGLVNRLLEASGRPSSSKVLDALQCSTQYVGFANAVTYGLNREMRSVLRRDLRRVFCGWWSAVRSVGRLPTRSGG